MTNNAQSMPKRNLKILPIKSRVINVIIMIFVFYSPEFETGFQDTEQ
jgi:hypothetical protein